MLWVTITIVLFDEAGAQFDPGRVNHEHTAIAAPVLPAKAFWSKPIEPEKVRNLHRC